MQFTKKLFVFGFSLFFLQSFAQGSIHNFLAKNPLNISKSSLGKTTQCRPLNNEPVNWPARKPAVSHKSAIDCAKMFNRLAGQTLYFYDYHDEDDPLGGILLKSNFFKYPEALDCFDEKNNSIDCPNLDIEKVTFTKQKNNTLIASILHPDLKSDTARVSLLNNEKICQISILPNSKTTTYKSEIYNILAIYAGRKNKNHKPACDEESLGLAPTFQDVEAKNLCKANVEKDFQEALTRVNPKDRQKLQNRTNELKKDCDKAILNQMRLNFILSPDLNF